MRDWKAIMHTIRYYGLGLHDHAVKRTILGVDNDSYDHWTLYVDDEVIVGKFHVVRSRLHTYFVEKYGESEETHAAARSFMCGLIALDMVDPR